MQKFQNHLIGVDRGSRLMFSDFEEGGVMWTGSGPREVRLRQAFSEKFKTQPVVWASISMIDVDHETNQRFDLSVGDIDLEGFDLVFRTWDDTRIARARVDWGAMGEVRAEDEWDL
jgi:hypothetical protein